MFFVGMLQERMQDARSRCFESWIRLFARSAGLQLPQEREQNTPLCGAFPKNLFWTDAVAPWSGGVV